MRFAVVGGNVTPQSPPGSAVVGQSYILPCIREPQDSLVPEDQDIMRLIGHVLEFNWVIMFNGQYASMSNTIEDSDGRIKMDQNTGTNT